MEFDINELVHALDEEGRWELAKVLERRKSGDQDEYLINFVGWSTIAQGLLINSKQ